MEPNELLGIIYEEVRLCRFLFSTPYGAVFSLHWCFVYVQSFTSNACSKY